MRIGPLASHDQGWRAPPLNTLIERRGIRHRSLQRDLKGKVEREAGKFISRRKVVWVILDRVRLLEIVQKGWTFLQIELQQHFCIRILRAKLMALLFQL